MFTAPQSPWLVPFDGSFRIEAARTAPPEGTPTNGDLREALEEQVDELKDLQRRLYANNRISLLLMFQAMDAAGKDSTIRRVLTGVNPAGCQVFSYGPPSSEELDHDFLWRCLRNLPERGRIGVFNRSWYEEVLVVRVHPHLLEKQRLPWQAAGNTLWVHRMESIRDVERHLARNGTAILKFFLHVSPEEQRRRFLKRIDRRDKNWKFSEADVRERQHWDAYQEAYEVALRSTSTSWAPWYAVPADSKPFLQLQVAEILVQALKGLDLHYPVVDDAERARLTQMRGLLEHEDR